MNIDNISREEAFKQGFLKKKKIILMPSPRKGKMVTDPQHISFFKMDGTSTFFCLPVNSRGDLVKIFEGEKANKERAFFEQELGIELNESKPGNFFEGFNVKVTKDHSLMKKGHMFDLSEPMDNIRARIVMKNSTVAPSWDERLNRGEYVWAIIDQNALSKENAVEFDSRAAFWKYIGKIEDELPKFRKTIDVYFRTINSKKKVPFDASSDMLKGEVSKISEDNSTREKFLDIVQDRYFTNKVFALQAMECGAVKKEGNDSYLFTGNEETFTFDEIAKKIQELKEEQDDLYLKIISQIEKHNS